MQNLRTGDIWSYIKKYYRYILLSAVFTVICFGALVFGGEIRIDTEELLNQPGTTLGWLKIGRYGLVFLKRLLGLGTHSVLKSGLLFLLFFVLGTNFLGYTFYYFSGKKEHFPYGLFLLLYCTSNIWSFQVYFSLQQAEVALAMLLLAAAAFLSMQACFVTRGGWNVLRLACAGVFLVIGLGSYQALAAWYIAVCIAMFLMLMENECKREHRHIVMGILELVLHFGFSYLIYSWIANTWFMETAGYMGSQMGWGRLPVMECIKNVLRTAKNLVIGFGPRNFSFYVFGVLLVLILLVWRWRHRQYETWQEFLLTALAFSGMAATPFLMTIYMGEMLVTRSQFALPVAAAFLGMYGIGELSRVTSHRKWMRRVCVLCAALTVLLQTGYNLRQAHVDRIRYEQDVLLTEEILADLRAVNGGKLPDEPVLFAGYRKTELPPIWRRTEMYGWSFYEWDYSIQNPTGATHRIAGFIQADTGYVLNENATEEQRAEAAVKAEKMPVYPAKGSVKKEQGYILVKLSELTERTDVDWW